MRGRIVWAVRHHTFHHSWNLQAGSELTRRQQAFITDERFPLLLEFLRIDTLASLGSSPRMDSYAFYWRLWQETTGNPGEADSSC